MTPARKHSFNARCLSVCHRFCLTADLTHHESDGSLLVDIDGDVGALDPGVGAQVPQSYIRVSGRRTAQFQFYCWGFIFVTHSKPGLLLLIAVNLLSMKAMTSCKDISH